MHFVAFATRPVSATARPTIRPDERARVTDVPILRSGQLNVLVTFDAVEMDVAHDDVNHCAATGARASRYVDSMSS